jgi:transcriptional regulator with XRE-family HTH domain
VYEQIGDGIRRLRIKIGINGVDLARFSSIANSYLSQIENNKVKAKRKTLNKIMEGFEELSIKRNVDCEKEIAYLKKMVSTLEKDYYFDQKTEDRKRETSFTNYDKQHDLSDYENFTRFISDNTEMLYRLAKLYNTSFKKEVEHHLDFILSYNESKISK